MRVKSKHIDTVHVYKSEQDFVSKYDIKTQPPLFNSVGVVHIMQSILVLRSRLDEQRHFSSLIQFKNFINSVDLSIDVSLGF